MADTAGGSTDRIQVFRTRAVRVAGLVDVVLGAALAGGGAIVATRGQRNGLPIGLTLSVLGLAIFVGGLGRITARLELSSTRVTWKWTFSKFEVSLTDLVDAALVEKGSPAPGASGAGFLGGGFYGVFIWWLLDLGVAFLSSEPSLGPLELVVIKRYGGAVSVKPISTWSSTSSHSEANDAVQAIKHAIANSADRMTPSAPPLAELRYDAWDSRRDS